MLGMENPGSNSGKFYLTYFVYVTFYPVVTVLLEYLNHMNLQLFNFGLYFFCSCNSIAI